MAVEMMNGEVVVGGCWWLLLVKASMKLSPCRSFHCPVRNLLRVRPSGGQMGEEKNIAKRCETMVQSVGLGGKITGNLHIS